MFKKSMPLQIHRAIPAFSVVTPEHDGVGVGHDFINFPAKVHLANYETLRLFTQLYSNMYSKTAIWRATLLTQHKLPFCYA